MENLQVEVEFLKKAGQYAQGDKEWYAPEFAANYEAFGVVKRTGKKRTGGKKNGAPGGAKKKRSYRRRDIVPGPPATYERRDMDAEQ